MTTELDVIGRAYREPIARSKTPRGNDCIIPNEALKSLIVGKARGSYQRAAARGLAETGYIIGYKAQGDVVRGKAKNYKGRYEASLRNFANRVQDALPGRFQLEYDRVGPKGAWGYRLTDEV
ncbi:MAG: hypothetical protein WBK88_07060 [Methanothrix sp.]